MDKYNHWIGRLFSLIFYNGKPYAVTIGQEPTTLAPNKIDYEIAAENG